MVASLFPMLFKCVSSWQEGVSLWLVICHHDTQKMFSHFTHVLESELSSVFETCIRAAWLLNLSFKKNQPKSIIRTGVTVPNVQKCVMVAIPTSCILKGEIVLPILRRLVISIIFFYRVASSNEIDHQRFLSANHWKVMVIIILATRLYEMPDKNHLYSFLLIFYVPSEEFYSSICLIIITMTMSSDGWLIDFFAIIAYKIINYFKLLH